jgi:hypothetical protein
MNPDELKLLDETLLGLSEAERSGGLTAALDAFGWLDVLAAEPRAAIVSLFGAQGRNCQWSAALQDVLATDLARLGVEGDANVVLPRPNSPVAGAWEDGGGVALTGLLLGPRDISSTLVAPVRSSGTGRLLMIAAEPTDILVTPQLGLDPKLDAYQVSGAVNRLTVLAEGEEATRWWQAAQGRGRLGLCHQMVASLFAMIELARSHVSDRVQFGRFVGTFQAVRHKLAEAHVATTAAECCAMTAWEADDRLLAAAIAKLITGRAVSVTAAHTQQLLAGIGFTAEHPYHRFMKRTLVLERMLGSAHELAPEVGRRLIERAEAPRLVEL